MPVKMWECSICGNQKTTKNPAPDCCDLSMLELINPPAVKLLERRGEDAKSVIQGQEGILKARARKHSRDVEIDDIIQNVNNEEITSKSGWIREDGRKKRGIDDA